MQHLPLIGGHVSAAGGFYHAIENAERIGATAIQFFGASPRQWFAKMPDTESVEKYHDALKKSPVKAVYLHAAYLPNLAAASEESYKKSVKNLAEHLQIVKALGAQGLIFHMGSISSGLTREQALEQTAKGMKEVLALVPGTTQLIMENSAGGGGKLGDTAKELGIIKKLVASDRVKVCIDTAHAFESGMMGPQVTPENVKKVFDEWDHEVGLENIIALHANDSKTAYNSHSDRHENIGHGEIGLAGFHALTAEKRLHHAAWILEVPGFDNEGPDKANVDILKKCFGN